MAAVYPSGGFAVLSRQLYLDLQPVDGFEFQYGSIGFNRGVNTEITSYDEDGYLDGERLIVRKPKYLYFDEVSVTYAYLGDILTANFFDRYNGSPKPTTTSSCCAKNSGSGFAPTAEKSFQKKWALQAGYADIDDNYDVYAHNGNNSIWAFALNGDAYGMGKRPFVRTTVNVTLYFSLFGYYSHIIDYNYARDGFIWNQTALNAGLLIDFKKLLKLNSR